MKWVMLYAGLFALSFSAWVDWCRGKGYKTTHTRYPLVITNLIFLGIILWIRHLKMSY